MRILVKYFAFYREAVGKHEEEFDLKPGSTVRDLVDAIVAKYPGLELDKEALFILNQNIVREDAEVKDGDRLAIFPPTGGG